MAMKDSYGNPISTTSADARDAYDRGVQLFLGANFGAEEAFAASVTSDPGFALGHAARARASVMAGHMSEARTSIASAQETLAGADQRERQHVGAMALLLAGQPGQARAAVLAHVREFPRDALAAQLCSSVFGLIGFSGEAGREAELLA